ncbi:DUF2079 domain-containing protein [Kitasatospora sp. NPDC047058]|uniref:DUF2079 domain-containing protein n=1 Tax=Kitasatospora sp. NPDC047058 TaxID=3155620 RepID=UPI0033F349BF
MATTTRPTPARPIRRPGRHAPHVALAAALFAIYALTSVIRYQRYGSPSYDLIIFTQAVKAYAHLQAPIAPVKGDGFNLLGDHLSPITALLAPAWWIAPTPLALLVAQAALMAWSAGIISATAEQLLGRARGLCIGIAYGLSFGILRAVDWDFHEIAFAVPLIAMTGRQLICRRWTRAACWALPLILVKEDLGATFVAAVGVYIAVASRQRILGAALATAGLAATAAAIWWIIPHYNPDGTYPYWDRIPGAPWWHAPIEAAVRLQTWKTLGWTLGITGALAARSPLALTAVPGLLLRLASANPGINGTTAHYSATAMPVMFLAAADAATRLRRSPSIPLRQYADRATTALPAVAFACMCSLAYGPAALTSPGAWPDRADRTRDEVVTMVQPGAVVEAGNSIGAHLAARADVYWMGTPGNPAPEWIINDREEWPDGPDGDAVMAYPAYFHPGVRYEVVLHRDGITVLRRVADLGH